MPLGRKGLSNVIAVLLLILTAVSGGVILYIYSSGLMGSLQGVQPQQSYLDQIAIEYYDWTAGVLKVQLRNVGTRNIVIVDVFIVGYKVQNMIWGTCQNGLPVQASCLLQLTPPSAVVLQTGIAYSVVIATKAGTMINFEAVFGQSG